MSKDIGKRIADLRKLHNLSQQELADKLNVSNKTISKWECGNGTPDIDSLNKISEVFKITLDELVNDKINNKKEEVGQYMKNLTNDKKPINKKRLLISTIISFSAIIIATISLLCFFLIPRNPKIEESNIFNIDENSLIASCVVDNTTDTFSFYGTIEVPRTNRWYLYYDVSGLVEIKSKTVNLQVGDNTYYIVVENTAGDKRTYQVKIRRKPLYTVSYNTLGGDVIVDEIIQEGNLATYQEPVKEGYIFNGWDHDFSQPITSNITITASWVAKSLTINYLANNDTDDSVKQNVTYDTYVILKSSNEFYKKGYTISSWNTKQDGSGVSYVTGKVFNKYNISDNLTLYAQWTINQYRISATKNLEGAGSIQGIGSFNYNTTRTLTAITNDGYNWIGWYSKNNALITSSHILTITVSDFNVEYIAKWSAIDYLISLDVNNGNELLSNTKLITFGENFVLPAPTRIEATFLGWFDSSGKQYTNNQGESLINWDKANNTTLFAHYDINEYTVSTSININKAGNVQGAGLKEYGSTVVLTADTNEGYSFVGWFDGNSLLTTNYQYVFVMMNYPVLYTAKWKANDYIVTLNVNNGVAFEDNTKEVTFDSAYSLPITTRDGYLFAGWYLGANGTGTQLTDNNGNSIFAWYITNDTQVYAKWDIVTYTITYSLNDGRVATENPSTYTVEDLDIMINNPIRDGYEFEGWIGTGLSEATKDLTILAGSYGNRHWGAVWLKGTGFTAISSSAELLNISHNLTGYYYLTQDIDMTGVEFTTLGDENNPFTGVLDGDGFAIKNLNSESSLFHTLNGFIYNLNFMDCNISGENASVIANINNGVISKCKISGSISSTAYYNKKVYSTGIAITNNGIIEYCVTTGSITTNAEQDSSVVRAASFAIYNYGIIRYVYSTAIIKVSSYKDSSYGSPFVIKNEGVITYSFFAGDISVYGFISGYVLGVGSPHLYAFWNSESKLEATTCYISSLSNVKKHEKGNAGYVATTEFTNTTMDDLLRSQSFIKFGGYESDQNLTIYPENVWIFDATNYPKLFWEK